MNDKKIGNYYQKSAFSLKIIRYVTVLIFICFLISCTLIYRNDITVENIQFLAKYISLNDGSSHYYNDEFQINTTKSSDIFMLRDNVAIVDKTGVALYELSGSKLFNYSFSYSSPAAVSDSHKIFIYDIEGNELSIFNSFSKVFTQKYPYSVRSADINDNGFAVITGEKGYRSALIVYNDNFKEYFHWSSEENYLSSLSLAPNGRNVAVTTAKAENGSYKCGVRIFDASQKEPIYKTDEFDELPLYISYSENGKNLYVITDSSIKFYDNKLQSIESFKFNQSKIEKYYTFGDTILITELNNLSGNSTKVIIFSAQGQKIDELTINDSVVDVAVSNNKIYVLGHDCVFMYSLNEKSEYVLNSALPLNEQYGSILCDSEEKCYIANDTTVVRVEFDK